MSQAESVASTLGSDRPVVDPIQDAFVDLGNCCLFLQKFVSGHRLEHSLSYRELTLENSPRRQSA
jgi:hypothetical protein